MEQYKAMILSEKSKGQNNVYNYYVRQGDASENMIDLFGKDAQGTNKNMYRVDRDRVEKVFYYVPFCIVWIFELCK